MDARILVLDNDQSTRRLMTVALQHGDHKVFAFEYFEMSLAVLTTLSPDVIILDVNVRDEGAGWEFLQLLEMNDATASIPVIITTTAVHLPLEIQGYLAARRIRTVLKPFDMAAFQLLVRETLMPLIPIDAVVIDRRALPVLIVTEQEALQEMIATVLTVEGYLSVTVANGLYALYALRNAEYALILLDIIMPVMDGFAFLTAYNQQLAPHAPLVLLSKDHAMEVGLLPPFVVGALIKPFDASQLLAIVEQYVQPVQE